MRKKDQNWLSKTALLLLAFSLAGVFCFQIISVNQDQFMMIEQEFSHAKSTTSEMMPCCEGNAGHLSDFDVPPTRLVPGLLVFVLAFIARSIFVPNLNNFSILAYRLLAPPGPDLMLAVVKRE